MKWYKVTSDAPFRTSVVVTVRGDESPEWNAMTKLFKSGVLDNHDKLNAYHESDKVVEEIEIALMATNEPNRTNPPVIRAGGTNRTNGRKR